MTDYGYISFNKLFILLNKRNKNKQYLINNGIHRNTIYKLQNNENVTCEIISKLCHILKCQPKDIMEFVPKQVKQEKNISEVDYSKFDF